MKKKQYICAALLLVLVISAGILTGITIKNHSNKPEASQLSEKPEDSELVGYDDEGNLEMKQDGDQTLYSLDGGKTWSKYLTEGSGISGLEVKEVPE
jgi:hypothetical protein